MITREHLAASREWDRDKLAWHIANHPEHGQVVPGRLADLNLAVLDQIHQDQHRALEVTW